MMGTRVFEYTGRRHHHPKELLKTAPETVLADSAHTDLNRVMYFQAGLFIVDERRAVLSAGGAEPGSEPLPRKPDIRKETGPVCG
jgi:hypothetical protein